MAQSPSRSLSPTLHQSLNEFRVSTDSERPSSPSVLNGKARHADDAAHDADDAALDPLERVQRELERTKEEKDKLAAQYQNLLAKLTTMRTTLGNKLKQDAVCAALPPSSPSLSLPFPCFPFPFPPFLPFDQTV